MKKSGELILKELGGITVLAAESLLSMGITVIFTTRIGGLSASPYDSLNLAFHVGDDPRHVAGNRRRLSEAIGYDLSFLTCAEQVHGSDVVEVDMAERGSGASDADTAVRGADAMITKLTELPLAILTADCAPLALVDPVKRIAAVVHAGWRGTIAGIALKTAAKMIGFGCDSSDIIAFLGPTIGPCCYEVDEQLSERFRFEIGPAAAPEPRRVDLVAANRTQLERAGLKQSNITASGLCTSCHNDLFFSYRADGHITGRQAVLVAITPQGED